MKGIYICNYEYIPSPIQAAGIKTCRFSLFSKAFSEFECSVFKFLVLGSFYELVYAKVFVFQYFE